jgi:XTP/dITP diphosphohydrolase
VFGDVQVSGPEDVKRNWDAIKAAERATQGGPPPSVVGSVPFSQPALALAAQLQRRAERAGAPGELADLPVAAPADGAVAGAADDATGGAADDAVAGAVDGLVAGATGGAADDAAGGAAGPGGVSDIGAELFSLVAKARAAGLDPELELRAAARSYRERIQTWEQTRNGRAPG